MNYCASEFGESWSERGFPCENLAEFTCLDCGQAKCGDCAANCQGEGHEVLPAAASSRYAQRLALPVVTYAQGQPVAASTVSSQSGPLESSGDGFTCIREVSSEHAGNKAADKSVEYSPEQHRGTTIVDLLAMVKRRMA